MESNMDRTVLHKITIGEPDEISPRRRPSLTVNRRNWRDDFKLLENKDREGELRQRRIERHSRNGFGSKWPRISQKRLRDDRGA